MEIFKAIFIGGRWDGITMDISEAAIQQSITLKFSKYKPYNNHNPECVYNLSHIDVERKEVIYRVTSVYK